MQFNQSEVIEMADDPAAELQAIQAALVALSPLDNEGRSRAVAWLASALDVQPVVPKPGVGLSAQFGVGAGISSNGAGEFGTPKEFLAYKAPKTDVERITVLAFYLTHARGVAHFPTKDLSDLNTEAACPRFSNAAYTASNAMKKNGFLATASGGKRQISARGEALVNALPDREAVTVTLESMSGPRRSSGNRKKKARKE